MIRLMAILAVLFLLFVTPVVVLLLSAGASSWGFPEIIPAVFDSRSLRYLALNWRDIAVSLFSSCLYSGGAVVLTFLMTILPARVFARSEFPGKHLLEGLLLAPALIPSMAFAMGAHFLFLRLGIADTLAGVVLILAIVSYPYMLRALTAGYQVYGERFALCARNLGASPLRVLLTVELPLTP